MPSLGADMESGKLVRWLVEPGSAVKKGDVIAVVETHKGAFDIDVFLEGVVSELCAKEGEELPVGALLARIAAKGEEVAALAKVAEPAPPPPAPAPPSPPVAPPTAEREAKAPGEAAPAPATVAAVPAAGRRKISPAARRRAKELGIDPETLAGTGIDGSVTFADVELAGAGRGTRETPPAGPAEPKRRAGFDPGQMRQAIAAAMSRSKREIPHYYIGSTIDMAKALGFLEAYNGERPPEQRILPAVLLLKATALALRDMPQFNGFWEDGRFRKADGIHIGWAIALRGGGLIAPAIRDTGDRPLADLMDALRDLVGRARGGGIRGSEMMEPTFTVTSMGDRGAESVFGVIYPPQVAILGFGRVIERPWVVDGKIVARPLVTASLAADHRASDGHGGSLFLAAVDRYLQEPEAL
ncbi:pyruvate dehydrogenase E2 component (dihydrolipoamide acetyltransferase) [Rhizobiaceae bacterium]|nr:pyruvate dehydrogenase E2 component (dihydrolipoamide acetyltransferase) [Rhizobiaceae bacterium]